METNLICPVCNRPLTKREKIYKCSDGHVYDIAKEGYVNLMLANNKNSKQPGDNKDMMIARRDFLNSGAYSNLVTEIIKTIKMSVTEDACIVEAGCGEGYYISNIKHSMPKCKAYGFDISKDAIKMAAKRNSNVNFFVSSSYKSNILSKSVDALVVVFAPFAVEEFSRILADSGQIILVTPKTEHLFELKNQLYSKIKDSTIKSHEGFYVYKSINVTFDMYLSDDQINNLFKMTPFFYQASRENKEKLDVFSLKNGIKADFLIEVLKKIKN